MGILVNVRRRFHDSGTSKCSDCDRGGDIEDLGDKATGKVSQFDAANLEASVTFLSTNIRSHPTLGGFTMTQEEFIRDFFETWEMSTCKPLFTPGEPAPTELQEEYK